MRFVSEAPPWWQRTTVYQIYPRSFFDKNGDGIGDLPGILDKLDYLRDLGVETLWLSPFFKSPQRDVGYDISDYYDVAPEYGTRDDVRRLLDAAHSRGLRVILDMVLNHTSDQHPWFVESRASRDNPRRDFYIWRKGRRKGGGAPPNNWRSLVGQRGWHYDATTDEWYFASFLPFQPDLNYRNPAVQQAMLDMVRHWLAQGFDGLRLDVFHALFKDAEFTDNPMSSRLLPSEDNPDGFLQAFSNTLHHPDTMVFARKLRQVVDEFKSPTRFLVGEVFGSAETLRRYSEGGDGLHTVFLFKAMRTELTAPAFRALISEFETEFPAPLFPTYVFGNHDRPRRGERLGYHLGREKLLTALQFTVRGLPFIYYGEELGMRNVDLDARRAIDPVAHIYRFVPTTLSRWLRKRGVLINRDEARTPMQWSDAEHAGFCPKDAKPWLPVDPQYQKATAAAAQADPESLWNCYRRILKLRREEPALSSGTLLLHSNHRLPPTVLAYRRTDGDSWFEVVANFGEQEQPVNVPGERPTVMFSTYAEPAPIYGRHYVLRPFEAIVAQVLADSRLSPGPQSGMIPRRRDA
ncbi:MAG TPA: alpha-glucosidase [Pseudomonadota bacterium]|nr:alpha-glucosidase [Pseudomonadota bacterium]